MFAEIIEVMYKTILPDETWLDMLLCQIYATTGPCFELVQRVDQRKTKNSSEGLFLSTFSRLSVMVELKMNRVLHTANFIKLVYVNNF